MLVTEHPWNWICSPGNAFYMSLVMLSVILYVYVSKIRLLGLLVYFIS